ncbi:MAG: flagellar biosynthesis protein FlhF [Oscillospiraceae bacterium]|jgi:flagellar biosynthesis protein FlhF|nr:flagellar biosynthesis protein FlhF [Oscillospiraceae bacterium]
MEVKKYRANNMQEALDTIKRELGSDAVILSSQKVKPRGLKNLFKSPVLEVMVAYEPEHKPFRRALTQSRAQQPRRLYPDPAAAPSVPPPLSAVPRPPVPSQTPVTIPIPAPSRPASPASVPAEAPVSAPAPGAADEKLRGLNNRLDSLEKLLGGFMDKFSMVKRDITFDYPEGVEALAVKLIENQVREELVHSLCRDAVSVLQSRPDASPGEVMRQLITEQFGPGEPISHKKFKRRVVLVAGATGVGKTTTIVKLAANFSIKQKKKVGIINTDSYRIGAQEQLRTYADILDMPVKMVYNPEEITEALAEMQDRDIVFIDTAGKKPGDAAQQEDMEGITRLAQPDDTLLCISAATSFSSMREIVDAYAFFGDYKLLITKLDETKSRGMLLNLVWYSKKRVSYVTTGQTVPDDVEPVNADEIASSLIK